MANKKFSEFVLKTSTSDVSHIVGYTASENVQITPANFVTTGGTGVFLPLAGGTMTGTNGVVFPDNFYLNLGTSSDFEIYHDGNNSYLKDQGTGELILASNGTGIKLEKTSGEKMIHALTDGAVELYYDSVKKFETTLLGATVTGDLLVTGTITGTGGSFLPLAGGLMVGDTTHNDNVKSIYGSPGNDLEIYHDGSDGYIKALTDDLILQSADDLFLYVEGGANGIISRGGSATELYFNNANKLATTNTGISVTGNGDITGDVNVGTGLAGTINVGLTSEYKGVIEYLAAADTNLNIKNTYDGAAGRINFQLCTSGTTVNALSLLGSGDATFGGDVSLGNVKKLKFGLSSDASLQWNNTNNEFEINTSADASEISITAGTTNTYTSEIQIGARSSAQGEGIFFKTRSAEKMRLDASGNLGLGTSSVGASDGRLKISAPSGVSAIAGLSLYGNNSATYGGSNVVRSKIESSTDGTAFGSNMLFSTNDTSNVYQERMKLDSSGNLGVGTSTPLAKAHILKGVAGSYTPIANANTLVVESDVSTGISIIGTGAAGTTQSLIFGTPSDVTGAQISYNSNNSFMSIGTTSASNFLQFLSGNGSEGMRLSAAGDVLFGKSVSAVSTAGIAYEKATNSFFSSIANSEVTFAVYETTPSPQYRFYVNGGGQIFATNTSITAISDISLKENIKPLETGLNEVMKLQPRRFDWKNGDGENIAGFIAQEVEEVLPDLVSDQKYTDKETKKSLKMGDMIPTLVNAIQELKAEIELLKNK